MSLSEPQIPEQTSSQEQTPPALPPVPPQPQAQPKHGFSGKQVIGIIFGVLILLAVGAAIGGAIGYRLGMVEGVQQAAVNRPAAQLPSFNQQAPNQQAPRGFQMPFGQELPAINPGGPYLGVTFQMITPEIAAQENITGTTGALVREVAGDGPAAQAGLKAGDVVIAVNGQPVNDQNDLRSRVAAFQPNDEITLTVVKGTANGPIDQRDVKVKLGERPAMQSFNFEMPFGDDNGQPVLPFGNNGLPQLPDMQPATTGAYLGIEYEITTTGALIKSVVADSPAATAGLQAGEVISAVDGKQIDQAHNLRDVVGNHQAGDEITLTIVTSTGDRRDVKVTLAARPVQQFQLPPGFQQPAPGLDSREG